MNRRMGWVVLAAAWAGIAVGGELWVANYSGNRQNVEVFSSADAGNAYPLRTLSGPGARMDWPWGVALDGQRLYVANYTLKESNHVAIYRLGASGSNVVPERTISCPQAKLARAIAVDTQGIVVCSAAYGIATFASDASGDALPRYRIYGIEHGLDSLGGMAADAAYIYAGTATEPAAIHVFRRTDNGTVAPLRTLRCTACSLRNVGAMAADARHLYVLNDPGTTTNLAILVFDKTAAGDVRPLRRIAGNRTGLSDCRGIAVDDQYIYVTCHDRTCIRAFPIEADGNVPPHHVISPEYPNPSLFALYGIAVAPETLCGPVPPAPGVSIAADGIRGAITAAYPAPVSVAVSATAGQHAGVPVDWFVVAVPDGGAQWYALAADGNWTGFPANDLAACRPALQAPLGDIQPPVPVLRGAVLMPGGYAFFAVADYPADGALNLIPGCYLSDAVRVQIMP